ncbi:hypothetical protein [Sphingomonas nostoxanthinifaciens]|uniref:hypothetical protein n=1 Tax=Sphingomonas nostoxanthinifaciens TaxID=2872652 RepID=UPI001CC2056D|nr:hypothetical protein [Sphingomonas nostoxanthinifaciens]UAK23674.1 hypothetical protein K8P63_14980 [Sphingomonas nostoxanthinifaciens]
MIAEALGEPFRARGSGSGGRRVGSDGLVVGAGGDRSAPRGISAITEGDSDLRRLISRLYGGTGVERQRSAGQRLPGFLLDIGKAAAEVRDERLRGIVVGRQLVEILLDVCDHLRDVAIEILERARRRLHGARERVGARRNLQVQVPAGLTSHQLLHGKRCAADA